jgi:hypothetical protein
MSFGVSNRQHRKRRRQAADMRKDVRKHGEVYYSIRGRVILGLLVLLALLYFFALHGKV